MLVCCFQNFCVQLFFSARSRVFLLFFRSEASNGFPVKSMFLEGLFLNFWCNVDTLKMCLRNRAPQLSLTRSQPAEAGWRQQLQRFDLLGWVFQRCYSIDCYIFFVHFQFLSPGNEMSFCWCFVIPSDTQIHLLLQNWYALWVSLWTFVFSFSAKFLPFIIFHCNWKKFLTYLYNLRQCKWYQKHE